MKNNNDTNDTFEETFAYQLSLLNIALRKLIEEFKKALEPLVQGLHEFITTAWGAIEEEYKKAGSPYGDDFDGIRRWIEEKTAMEEESE